MSGVLAVPSVASRGVHGEFRSDWATWQPKNPVDRTDKTISLTRDKSPDAERPPADKTDKTSAPAAVPTIEEVRAWPLAWLQGSDLVVVVRSAALGAEVLLVGDRAFVAPDESRAKFTVQELLHLIRLGPTPEELRRLSDVKRIFGGLITGIEASAKGQP